MGIPTLFYKTSRPIGNKNHPIYQLIYFKWKAELVFVIFSRKVALHLKIIGVLLVLPALVHVIFPR